MSEIFILLATFDPDPDPIPNEIWAFAQQVEAENCLKSWAEEFLGGYTHAVDDLPADGELVKAFVAAGAHVHLYQCHLDGGGGDELVPFARAAEAA